MPTDHTCFFSELKPETQIFFFWPHQNLCQVGTLTVNSICKESHTVHVYPSFLYFYLRCHISTFRCFLFEPRQANLCLRAFRHDKLYLRMPCHSEGPGIWFSV